VRRGDNYCCADSENAGGNLCCSEVSGSMLDFLK